MSRLNTSRVEGSTPRPLSDLSAVSVGGTVYLIGGYDGVSPQRTIYSTRDGVRFRTVAAMPQGLRYAAAAAWGSKVIVAGGVTANGLSRRILSFDPNTGRVRTIGRLPAAVGHAVALSLGGLVFVLGGANEAGTPRRDVIAIDPRTGSAERAGRLPAPVADAAAVVLGSQAWIFGGARSNAVGDVLVAGLG